MGFELSEKQMIYIAHKTGEPDPQKALDIFLGIFSEMNIDIQSVPKYLTRLMEIDKI